MSDTETPLVLTLINRFGAPLFVGTLELFGLTLPAPISFLSGLCLAPVFIWLIVRTVNHLSDPRRTASSMPDRDDEPPADSTA